MRHKPAVLTKQLEAECTLIGPGKYLRSEVEKVRELDRERTPSLR